MKYRLGLRRGACGQSSIWRTLAAPDEHSAANTLGLSSMVPAGGDLAQREVARVKQSDLRLYGERAAPVYDQDIPACPDLMLDTLERIAGRGRVLELGIGTGRVALPLAARGVRVEGVDISAAMVAQLRMKPGGLEIPVSLGSFADMRVQGLFDLIYVVFNTFYMLRTREEQARCLEGIVEHLNPEGVFVFEGFLRPRSEQSRLEEDPAQDTVEYLGMGDRGPRYYSLGVRVPTPAELDSMAKVAGLSKVVRWATWDGSLFTRGSRSHISMYKLAR